MIGIIHTPLSHNRIGRKIIYSFGFFMMALGMALFPHATEINPSSFGSFFQSLYFYRFLFAVGSSATSSMLTAVLSDYGNPLQCV